MNRILLITGYCLLAAGVSATLGCLFAGVHRPLPLGASNALILCGIYFFLRSERVA